MTVARAAELKHKASLISALACETSELYSKAGADIAQKTFLYIHYSLNLKDSFDGFLSIFEKVEEFFNLIDYFLI